MRKSSVERLREAKREKMHKETLDLEGLLKLLVDGERKPEERRVNPTQKACVYASDRITGYMGPAGCAKTSTIAALGFLRALLEPGSKGLVAREDYNDLLGTTALRMEEMLQRLPPGTRIDRDKSAPMRWWIQPANNGDISMITFMGLKEGLGSYEFDWAIIDEMDECEEKRVREVNSRLRHKPRSGIESYRLCGAFNPPDKHHWLYTACTGRNFQDKKIAEPWMKVFRPQPDENVRNLPNNYYADISKGMTEDMLQRLVDGEWGSTFNGQPVYREFKPQVHLRDSLEYDPHTLMFRFWDFGYRHPACVWAQQTFDGRLHVLREEVGTNEEAINFARRCQGITATEFPGCKQGRDYGDPAVRQKKDTGSTLAKFAEVGITILWKLYDFDESIRVVRKLHQRLIDGEPAVLYSRPKCSMLVGAMRGGYRMDDRGLKPFKDGDYDHVADAFRYGVINLYTGYEGSQGAGDQNLPENGTLEYDSRFDTGAA